MIKVLAFDYGGVLGCEADDWTKTFWRVTKLAGLTSEKINEIFVKHWKKLRIGSEPVTDFWDDIANVNNVNSQLLQKTYDNSIVINEKMMDLVNKLKKDYKVVVISNDAKEWMDAKRKRFKWGEIFDNIYCSGNLGLAKPDERVFRSVLDDLGIKPQELLYFDNQENNIVVAKSMEINALLFTDYSHAITHIQRCCKDIIGSKK